MKASIYKWHFPVNGQEFNLVIFDENGKMIYYQDHKNVEDAKQQAIALSVQTKNITKGNGSADFKLDIP